MRAVGRHGVVDLVFHRLYKTSTKGSKKSVYNEGAEENKEWQGEESQSNFADQYQID